MSSPPRALIEVLPDELLALVFTAAAAPDRLRCEQVCKRWRRVLGAFAEILVLPHDTSDDSPNWETTPEGWTMLRETARDDSLIAASKKARGRLRTLDVRGCGEITHDAVISVLRENRNLVHLKMSEVEADSHRLRIRPRQLVDVARALGNRADECGSSSTLEASVEVAGNRELETLRDVVVDAARRATSTGDGSARAQEPLIIGGTRVVISALTLSLLFLERARISNATSEGLGSSQAEIDALGSDADADDSPDGSEADAAFLSDSEADERTAETSAARETARVAATHLVEIIQTLGPRGLARLNFGERSLVDEPGASRVLRATRRRCGASLREIRVDGEAIGNGRTRDQLFKTLNALGTKGGARRVTVHRSWLEGSREVSNRRYERGEGSVGGVGGESTATEPGSTSSRFGTEKFHLEAPNARLLAHATRDATICFDAFSVAKPPDGDRRALRSASLRSRPGTFCAESTARLAEILNRVEGAPRYFDVSNLNTHSKDLERVLRAIARLKSTRSASMKVLAISGNGEGHGCSCGAQDLRSRSLAAALAGAIEAQAETLRTLDIGGIPRRALARAMRVVAGLPALTTLDLSTTPMGGVSKRRLQSEDAEDEDDSKSLSRLLGDALGTSGCRVRCLVLVSCSLTAAQLRDIVAGALRSSTVTDAILSYNSQLGDDGCAVVARWIRGGSKKKGSPIDPDARFGCLLRVSLEGCGVSDVGARTLAGAVSENRALRRLDLASNVGILAGGRNALAAVALGRPGIWTKETVDDAPWAAWDSDSDAKDDDYHSEDDGYFQSERRRKTNAVRPFSRWAFLESSGNAKRSFR